nr:proton-conducting transporter membrane subunit [Deltaproteobacteria bacterium]
MVNGILDFLWLVPGLPLLGVILNGAIALFAERPLLLAEAPHGDEGHGTSPHGASSHGADTHGGHHATAPYRKLVGFIGPAVVGGAFVVAILSVLALAGRAPHDRIFVQVLFPWIQAGGFSAAAALQLDPLSSVMILVVTGVGFLIHVYSVGYMSHEKAVARYFVYLNLFTFAMLVLVLGSNYLLMFVGWEGVGLCSYLLIGYWYEKKSASDAGK